VQIKKLDLKLKPLPHKCLDCTKRTQRFNFDVKKVKGGCLDCIKNSNFIQMDKGLQHGIN